MTELAIASIIVESITLLSGTLPIERTSIQHSVSDEKFSRVKQILGKQGVVDLTALTGTYVTVAMLLSMAEEGVPPDKEPPFKPGE